MSSTCSNNFKNNKGASRSLEADRVCCDELRVNGSIISGGIAVGGVLEVGADPVTTNRTTRQNIATPGVLISDALVYGSTSTEDQALVAEDDRIIFISNTAAADHGAFRAGQARATEWDAANRGNSSVAFGRDCTASANRSFACGDSNVASGINSAVLSGLNCEARDATTAVLTGTTNIISATTTDNSSICGGLTNSIGTNGRADQCCIVNGEINLIEMGIGNTIGGGTGNQILQAAVGVRNSIIAGGATNTIDLTGSAIATPGVGILAGAFNTIQSTGTFGNIDQSVIVGGDNNDIDARFNGGSVRDCFIGAGESNSIVSTAATDSDRGAIVSGTLNVITDSINTFIGSGQSNLIGTAGASAGHSAIVGGLTNTITGTGDTGFIGAGTVNIVGGARSGVVCGQNNTCTAADSCVVCGDGITLAVLTQALAAKDLVAAGLAAGDGAQRYAAQTTLPAITANATITAASTDTAGEVTAWGANVTNPCTITFVEALAATVVPIVTISANAAASVGDISVSARSNTAFSVTSAAAAAASGFTYHVIVIDAPGNI